MFERYTEKARRVIFFARYEASQFGSPCIQTEHILLGLLREDKALVDRFLHSLASIESIRKRIEAHSPVGEKISTSVDMPLSEECKRVLFYAAEEAERLAHKHIGTEHLLLGLLREEKCFAAVILHERGLQIDKLREEVGELIREKAEEATKGTPRGVSEKAARRPRVTSLLSQFTRDLTQSAAENELDPLIGREVELERVIQALCRRTRNNAVLVGEPGVGKKAIVRGLAQRIAEARVPSRLAGDRLLILHLSSLVAFARDAQRREERFAPSLKELVELANVIFFIEDLLAKAGARGSLEEANIVKPLLTQGELQCIAAATPGDYQKAIEEEPWLRECFNAVEVRPPDEAEAIKILAGIKQRFEQFHSVTYTDEALQYAVLHSQRYLPGRFLPDKAIDLIDEAGAAVAVRVGALPAELADAQKRLKFVMERMENAVASHEFEKAKYYSDEERKERENLGQLRAKYKLETTGTVTLDDIENVVARWTDIPIARIQQERGGPGAGGHAG